MTFETSLKVTWSLFTLCCDLLKSITMNLSILILNKLIFVHVMYVRLVVYLLKKKIVRRRIARGSLELFHLKNDNPLSFYSSLCVLCILSVCGH